MAHIPVTLPAGRMNVDDWLTVFGGCPNLPSVRVVQPELSSLWSFRMPAKRKILVLAAAAALIGALLAPVEGFTAAPARSTPAGRLSRTYFDSARTDWDGRGPRPLAATVWYPAAPGSQEATWGAGVFRFGRSARDAAFVDESRRPLIVLSHGTGGSAAQLAWLAEELAAQGFVVAAVNHHGNTATEERYRPAGFVLPWERARDLSVLIDRLASDSAIAPHVDTTRVGAAGFSLGAYTALALAGARLSIDGWRQRCATTPGAAECALPPEASFTMADVDSLARTDTAFRAGMARGDRPTLDARIRAVFAMAPALVPALDTTALRTASVPMRVVLGASDAQVPPAQTAAWLARYAPRAVIETRPAVTHYAFLAECTWRGRLFVRALCADSGMDRAALHAAVVGDAVPFFQQHLPADDADR
jgi:predicted dienelactone hydrolase